MGSKYFYSPIRCANGIFSLHTRGNLWPRLNEKYFFFSLLRLRLLHTYTVFFFFVISFGYAENYEALL